MRRAAALSLVFAAAACSGGAPSSPDAPGKPTQLTLAPVAWNASNADVGKIDAVAETGATVAVFGASGATVMTSGAVSTVDGSIATWRSAGFLPEPGGAATWLVGVDGDGKLRHVKSDGTLEDASDRFGLLGAKIADVAASSASPFGFLLDDGVATSDGVHVTRYGGAQHAIAAGGAHVAIASDGAVRVFDASGAEKDVALADASFVAVDPNGAVYAATHHALYAIDGGVKIVFDASPRTIHGLVASGASMWMALDGELALYRDGQASVTDGFAVAPDARIFASPSGDIWVLSAAQLQRFSGRAAAAPGDDHGLWQQSVLPVYARVCSNCHSPKGTGKDSANTDLSSYDAWKALRGMVLERVVTDVNTPRQMPPPSSGYSITPAELDAIKNWATPK